MTLRCICCTRAISPRACPTPQGISIIPPNLIWDHRLIPHFFRWCCSRSTACWFELYSAQSRGHTHIPCLPVGHVLSLFPLSHMGLADSFSHPDRFSAL